MAPTPDEELALLRCGHRAIAGLDEAGRGCWAGPVVAAAVVLPLDVLAQPDLLAGVDDSKALSRARREDLFSHICAIGASWGIGVVPAHVIDTHGILTATRVAMQIAILRLPTLPDALLIDAVQLYGWPSIQRALIRGDARCVSIAAASIIAKVTRDRLMDAYHRAYPQYGFAVHKGYGTADHELALQRFGPTGLHRATFRPIVEFLTHGAWPARRRTGSATIPAAENTPGENNDD